MDDAIKAFVMYLQVERNASPETIRNYRSDLHQLARFLQRTKKDAASLRIDEVTRDDIRAFLRDLDQQGEKASSLARKLACLRSFLGSSYGMRSCERTLPKSCEVPSYQSRSLAC